MFFTEFFQLSQQGCQLLLLRRGRVRLAPHRQLRGQLFNWFVDGNAIAFERGAQGTEALLGLRLHSDVIRCGHGQGFAEDGQQEAQGAANVFFGGTLARRQLEQVEQFARYLEQVAGQDAGPWRRWSN